MKLLEAIQCSAIGMACAGDPRTGRTIFHVRGPKPGGKLRKRKKALDRATVRSTWGNDATAPAGFERWTSGTERRLSRLSNQIREQLDELVWTPLSPVSVIDLIASI